MRGGKTPLRPHGEGIAMQLYNLYLKYYVVVPGCGVALLMTGSERVF